MSPKLGAMTERMPKSSSAQGACSRDDPQPKFSPATRMTEWRQAGLLSTKSGFSEPSSFKRMSRNRPRASPVRSTVLRNCLGMIMSVSTLIMGKGAATPVRVVNLCMGFYP